MPKKQKGPPDSWMNDVSEKLATISSHQSGGVDALLQTAPSTRKNKPPSSAPLSTLASHGIKPHVLNHPIVTSALAALRSKKTYICFDTETSGFSADNDQLLEIGAVRKRGALTSHRSGAGIGVVLSSSSSSSPSSSSSEFVMRCRLLPGKRIHFMAERVNGIKNSDAFDLSLPSPLEIVLAFANWIFSDDDDDSDILLIAHNAAFDIRFLCAVIEQDQKALIAARKKISLLLQNTNNNNNNTGGSDDEKDKAELAKLQQTVQVQKERQLLLARLQDLLERSLSSVCDDKSSSNSNPANDTNNKNGNILLKEGIVTSAVSAHERSEQHQQKISQNITQPAISIIISCLCTMRLFRCLFPGNPANLELAYKTCCGGVMPRTHRPGTITTAIAVAAKHAETISRRREREDEENVNEKGQDGGAADVVTAHETEKEVPLSANGVFIASLEDAEAAMPHNALDDTAACLDMLIAMAAALEDLEESATK